MTELIEIHAYVDGELPKEDADRVREALALDATLAAEARAIETLKAATVRHARPCDCEQSWKACVDRLTELDRTRRVEGFFARYAWALCGAVFVSIIGGGLLNRGTTSNSVQSADLARVVSGLIPQRQVPQPTAAEKQWVDGLLGQAAASLNGKIYAYPMSTGEFDGHRVARIPLRDASGELALLVFDRDVRFNGLVPLGSADGSYAAGKISQLNCLAWQTERASLVLVGDRSPQDLAEVAGRIHLNSR